MACRTFPIAGGYAIACGRGHRYSVGPCSVPGCGEPGAFECDYPVTNRKSKTCDKKLCAKHTARVAFEKDYCPVHHRMEKGSP